MAKIIDGLSWSARLLIIAICFSATQSENSHAENYTVRIANNTGQQVCPNCDQNLHQCCNANTNKETSTVIGNFSTTSYTCNCNQSWVNVCCYKNTCLEVDFEYEQRTRCQRGWEGPACNITRGTSDAIRMPPSITRGPGKTVYFRSCEYFELECEAEGTPAVRYKWNKNGFELNKNLPTISERKDGTIRIYLATPSAEGFYQCLATNQYGTALSIMAHVQLAFLDTTSGPPNVVQTSVQEGMPFHIQAVPRNSFPKPTYGWEVAANTTDKNSTALILSKRIQIKENGDLYFSYVLPEDNLNGSIYKSITHNTYLKVKAGESYTQLTVTINPAGVSEFAPTLAFSSETPIVALIGESVKLRCFFSGYPEPNISWSGPWNTLPIRRYTLNNFNTELTINKINTSDEGFHHCTASNTLGNNTLSLQILVEAAPKFNSMKDGPCNVNLTEGDSVTFNCNAFAIPEATFVWLQNGHPIDIYNWSSRFVFSNNYKSLTIRDLCRDCADRSSGTDLMVIQCNASNVHGYAFASGYLNVLRRTKVLLPGSTFEWVNRTEENQFQFNCSATSDPSTPPTVQWFKVGPHGQESVHNEPPYVNVMNGTLSINIDPNCSTACDKYLGEYRCVGDNGYSRDFATVTLSAKDNYCKEELDEVYSIRWGDTIPGRDISHLCPGNAIGNCTRKCFLNSDAIAVWSPPNCNSCFDKEFNEILEKLYRLDASELKNQDLFAKIASSLSDLTNDREGLSAGNLNASVMIVDRLAVLRNNYSNYYPNEEEIKAIVQTASNILQPNNSKPWTELRVVNTTMASAVLFSSSIYGQSLSKIQKSSHSVANADFMVVEAWTLEKSNLPRTLEFPSNSFSGESSSDRISLSVETLMNNISAGRTLNVWGSYYRTINDYLPGKKDTDIINSRVLSLSIGGLKTTEKLKQPVIITMEHNQAKGASFRRTCSFWDFERGEWDSTGCSVTSTNFTHTICSCDHLTNFAILMSRYPSYDKALSVLSIIGCSLSVVALILTVIIYALTWKQSKSAQATVLLNLCVALIIAYIIFMAGADKIDSEYGCKAVAVLLHYFFLAAFFIMLAEGIELLLYVIFVFHVRRTIETILLVAAAWVLPLIIVAISTGTTHAKGYGNGLACWLSDEKGLMWAFIGPVLCIITANFVILAIVLRRMCQNRTFLAKNEKKRDEMRATLWNLSVTCPVLGLGWLFGVLSVAFSSVVFQYLFVITNSIQGLLLFIFHAVFQNKKISDKISYIYTNYISRCRNPDSTQLTLSQDPPQMPSKLGIVARAVKYYEGLEAQDSSTATQSTSIGYSYILEKRTR